MEFLLEELPPGEEERKRKWAAWIASGTDLVTLIVLLLIGVTVVAFFLDAFLGFRSDNPFDFPCLGVVIPMVLVGFCFITTIGLGTLGLIEMAREYGVVTCFLFFQGISWLADYSPCLTLSLGGLIGAALLGFLAYSNLRRHQRRLLGGIRVRRSRVKDFAAHRDQLPAWAPPS